MNSSISKSFFSSIFIVIFALFIQCKSSSSPQVKSDFITKYDEHVIPGADRMTQYIPELEGKSVALVVNHTSRVRDKHLIDSLIDFEIKIQKIFAPEHGFRGEADAGAVIKDGVDEKTGIPVVSLYGKHKKPSNDDLKGIDVVVFDIQDVGCRFYTYISTLTYVMEACAQNNIPVIILDRPNPNGHYIDGPILDPSFSSFVGLHKVPVVYGMTIGEYGMMVNGEKWMEGGIQCDLKVVTCSNYTHKWSEALPINPSPNLRSHRSILLYPSLCFFEGTEVSVGRGTETPFEHIGHPKYSDQSYSFTPIPSKGASSPKLENQTCYGIDFKTKNERFLKSQNQLDLSVLINFYKDLKMGESFFLSNNFIDKLAGTDELRKAIINGDSEEKIRASWQAEIQEFKKVREKYLLYK